MGKLFQSIKIEDARGRRIDFPERTDWSRVVTNLPEDEHRALGKIYMEDIYAVRGVKLTSHLGLGDVLLILGLILGIGLASLGMAILLPSVSPWLRDVMAFVFVAPTMILGFKLFFKWRCRSLDQNRPFPQAALGFGHCPACLYDLQRLAPEDADGCTVCPECGGAWWVPKAS